MSTSWSARAIMFLAAVKRFGPSTYMPSKRLHRERIFASGTGELPTAPGVVSMLESTASARFERPARLVRLQAAACRDEENDNVNARQRVPRARAFMGSFRYVLPPVRLRGAGGTGCGGAA